MTTSDISPEEELCALLRMKMAKALPAHLMPEFQQWVTLEQSLSYGRGRQDEADARTKPAQFEPT